MRACVTLTRVCCHAYACVHNMRCAALLCLLTMPSFGLGLGLHCRREEYYAKRGLGCYMFALDDGRVIDATTRGNVARYINHSCGGGNGSVQTNNLTGKTEAKGKGVSRCRHL
jgi:hypothetical protein